MRYFYRVYGLTMGSDTPVPGLQQELEGQGDVDVVLNLSSEPEWVQLANSLPCQVQHSEQRDASSNDDSALVFRSFGLGEFFELAYRDGVRFTVDAAGKRLWGACRYPLTVDDLATYLSGPVMGFILRRRGIISFHASAVSIGGQAVLLCGESQSGKSTTAAALAMRGVPVLCEDITPLVEGCGRFQAEPGYPRVCLWADAVQIVFGSPGALPQLTPTWEKYFLALDGNKAKFEQLSRPLGVIYLLAARQGGQDAPRVEEVSPRLALLELVQNTYMNRLLDRTQRAGEFSGLSRIVMQIPVRRIVPHRDPARIGALCDLIIADSERLFANRGPSPIASDL